MNSIIPRLALALCLCASALFAQINVPADQPTITAAHAVAVPGDTIIVAAGTYNENVTLTKRVTIIGAGSSPAGTVVNGRFLVQASGLDGSNRLSLQSMRVSNASGDGISLSGSLSFLDFQNLALVNCSSAGIDLDGGPGLLVQDVTLSNCTMEGNNIGLRCASNSWVEDVVITSCDFLNNLGFGLLLSGATNTGTSITRNWTINGGTFAGNEPTDTAGAGGAAWLRTAGPGSEITNFAINGATFRDNGSGNPFNRFGVSVFARNGTTVSGVTLDGCTFEETAAPGTQTVGVAVDVGATGTLSTPVAIDNCVFQNLPIGVNAVSVTHFSLSGTTFLNVTSPVLPMAGSTPVGVALTDLGNDSDLDIVTANRGDDSLSFLENDGSGVFDIPATSLALTAGDQPSAVVNRATVGGDTVAVACFGADVVRIVSGGSVSSTLALSGNAPRALAAGDFDGDGNDDLAIACQGTGFGGSTIEVNVGGVGTVLFDGSVTPGTATDVAVADLNGDGMLDVVAAIAGDILNPTANSLEIWQGDGLGGFTPATSIALSGHPAAVDAFDMDGDFLPELLVADSNFASPATSGLVIHTNTGAFGFSASAPMLGGLAPTRVIGMEIADDSIPGFIANKDAVTINSDATVSSFVGWNGTSFAATLSEYIFVTPTDLASGDLNGDGTADLVITTIGNDGVIVALGNTPALDQEFGVGCPGTGGLVPHLEALSNPVLGGAPVTLQLSNARPFAPVLLAISLGLDPMPFGGCTIYVELPVATWQLFTDGVGLADLVFAMPPAAAPFIGLDVFCQAAVFDPLAPGNLAFSNALRLQLGY